LGVSLWVGLYVTIFFVLCFDKLSKTKQKRIFAAIPNVVYSYLEISFTVLTIVPIPSTVASITSPSCNHSCGFRPAPTPDGVPVAIISPGSKVKTVLKSSIKSLMLKRRNLVFEFCFSIQMMWIFNFIFSD
jgi:hypothetical protein